MTDYLDFTYVDMPIEERRNLDIGDIFINQAKCLDCGWIIRSKNRHDVAVCRCGQAMLDGGSWYVRASGDVELHTVSFNDAVATDNPADFFTSKEYNLGYREGLKDSSQVPPEEAKYREVRGRLLELKDYRSMWHKNLQQAPHEDLNIRIRILEKQLTHIVEQLKGE